MGVSPAITNFKIKEKIVKIVCPATGILFVAIIFLAGKP